LTVSRQRDLAAGPFAIPFAKVAPAENARIEQAGPERQRGSGFHHPLPHRRLRGGPTGGIP